MSEDDRTDAQRLIALVMSRLGITADEDLAVVIGMVPFRARGDRRQGETNKIRKIAGWRNGTTAPSFEPLMAMLSAAELLAPEARDLFPPSEDAAQRLAAARTALEDAQRTGRRRRPQDDQEKSA